MNGGWLYTTPRLNVEILPLELRGEWLDVIELGGRVRGGFDKRMFLPWPTEELLARERRFSDARLP